MPWRASTIFVPLLPIIFAGIPTAIAYSGISVVTILPAPITAPEPIVTPPKTVTLHPI